VVDCTVLGNLRALGLGHLQLLMEIRPRDVFRFLRPLPILAPCRNIQGKEGHGPHKSTCPHPKLTRHLPLLLLTNKPSAAASPPRGKASITHIMMCMSCCNLPVEILRPEIYL
jgi:hypothetical protein